MERITKETSQSIMDGGAKKVIRYSPRQGSYQNTLWPSRLLSTPRPPLRILLTSPLVRTDGVTVSYPHYRARPWTWNYVSTPLSCPILTPPKRPCFHKRRSLWILTDPKQREETYLPLSSPQGNISWESGSLF